MADIIKTIGTGGDYTTLADWRADLDNGAVYSAGDIAYGDVLENLSFSSTVTIDTGSTIGLAGIVLRPDSGATRHTGYANTGAGFSMTGSAIISLSNTVPITLEDLDIRGEGTAVIGMSSNGATYKMNRCVVQMYASGGTQVCLINANTSDVIITNCVVYTDGTATSSYGIYMISSSTTLKVLNCTVYDMSSGGIYTVYRTNATLQNNLILDCGTDFRSVTGSYPAATDYNLSSDASAPGGNSVTSATPSDVITDTTVTDPDFSLKAGSSAIEAGTDLGTTDGAHVDILEYDRDAGGVAWDIGAYQLLSSSSIPVLDEGDIFSGGFMALSGGLI